MAHPPPPTAHAAFRCVPSCAASGNHFSGADSECLLSQGTHWPAPCGPLFFAPSHSQTRWALQARSPPRHIYKDMAANRSGFTPPFTVASMFPERAENRVLSHAKVFRRLIRGVVLIPTNVRRHHCCVMRGHRGSCAGVPPIACRASSFHRGDILRR